MSQNKQTPKASSGGSKPKGPAKKPSAKKPASKPAAAAKKKTSTAKKSSASSQKTMNKKQKRLLHRSIRACVYLFMAFVGMLSMFNVKGFMIDWYKWLVGSLFGFGYYLAPLAFIFAAVLIIIRMKHKVRAREVSIFMIPVFFGSIGHMVRHITEIPTGLEGFSLLASTGRELTSGGLISGSIGMILKAALSAGGGIVICVAAIIVCLFVATGTNPAAFLKKLKPSPEEDYDDEEEVPVKPVREKHHREPAPAKAPDLAADHMTAAISHEAPPRRSSSSFMDFFRKDKLSSRTPEPQIEASPRRDPTSPPVPTFSVEEAVPLTRKNSFAPYMSDIRPEEIPDLGENAENKIYPRPAAPEPQPQVKPQPEPAPEPKKPDLPFTVVTPPAEDAKTGDNHDFDVSFGDVPVFTPAPAPSSADSSAGAEKKPSVPASFDIFEADNPPPDEKSLDDKRRESTEALEKAASENDVSQIIGDAAKAEPGKYIYPPLSLLTKGNPGLGADHESIVRCAERLVDTLKSFNIEASIVNVTKGPTVTRYELQLQRGIKFAKVTALADDIALSLGAASVRIAPIPANNSVGIEVPNDIQETVSLRDILQNKAFSSAPSKLAFAVGKDIAGQCVVGDISKMPHLLIAGTTGSGKSVCINSIIISLIYKSSPDDVKLIMVDPKMIELGMYNGIPHLLIPVVTDPKKAAGALNWAVGEMMRRYKLLSEHNVRNLADYNKKVKSEGTGEPLPNIVIVIDELADLMFVAAREVEESIARIAQMARAAGMHLIIATQRPSADVITGLMKANIPSRIAFAVASQIESRIILDQNGAEKLIGRGDMLYNPLGAGKPMRVQGCFISSKEVESVIDFVKSTGTADYSQDILDHIERQAEAENNAAGKNGSSEEGDDPILMDAISVVVDRGEASTSLLQRRLKLGYARAARLIDIMEERGIVGPFEGSKPRSVSITPDQWKEMQLRMKD